MHLIIGPIALIIIVLIFIQRNNDCDPVGEMLSGVFGLIGCAIYLAVLAAYILLGIYAYNHPEGSSRAWFWSILLGLAAIGTAKDLIEKLQSSGGVSSPADKAFSLLQREGTGAALIAFYEVIQYYPSWSKRDDFDAKWNIGVKNLQTGNGNIKISYTEIGAEIVTFDLLGHKIELWHGRSLSNSLDYFATLYIKYVFDGKLVTTISATEQLNEYGRTYTFSGVEEFHSNNSAMSLLKKVPNLISTQKSRRLKIEQKESLNRQKDKFTF